MIIIDKALETQVKNLQVRTGKTLDELFALIRKSGLGKHGEIRDMLKGDLGMGHGDANTLVHVYLRSVGEPKASPAESAGNDILDEIYSGAKGVLRPIHEKVMAAINAFGTFEIAPKKGYLSLRRKKQFAMIGPGTKGRLEIGLNMKDVASTARLVAVPPGGMCQYKVFLASVNDADRELMSWVRQAYDAAG